MNETVKEIIRLLGGFENISSYTHCATRLRVQLKDIEAADEAGLKGTKGVLGVVKSGSQIQVIIGPKVDEAYAIMQQEEKTAGGAAEEAPARTDAAAETALEEPAKKKFNINDILSYISSSIAPVLPVLVASGLLSAVLAICTQVGILSDESSTYTVLSAISDAAFTYLPVLVAVAAAKKLNTNEFIAGFLAVAMMTSTISGVEGLSLFGINIYTVTYTSNIVPVLLMVPVLALLDRLFTKIIPKAATFILKPFLLVIIMAPLILWILGPIGSVIGAALANLCIYMSNLGGIAFGIAALFMPLLVVTGMHTMLIPVIVNELTTYGFSYFFSLNIAVNFAICGAAFAVGVKAKKAENKQLGISSGVTALLSVTEPALYGCLVRFKRPMITACIASGITGIFIGFMKIKGYAAASVSLLTMPVFMGEDMMNFVYACIAAAIALVLSFVITWFVGIDEEKA